MATSGTTAINTVRDTVIKKALRLVGAYSPLSKPSGNQIDDAKEALNMMIKAWQIQGFMWVQEYVTLFLVPSQRVYSLAGANGATTYDETTTTAALVATDTVIAVADTTGMAVGDVVGILLDSKAIWWDVILTVDSSVQITLTTGMSGAAASGNAVYAYDSDDAVWRPTRVFTAQRKDSTGYEVPMNSMGRDDYSEQVNKTTTGSPVQYYFDPQLNPAKLYLWPAPINSTTKIVLDIDRPLQVMVDSANTFDFPEEWIECLAYGLGVRLAPEYAVPLNERRELKSEFGFMVDNLMSYNKDWTSIDFGVETHG